MLFKQLSVLLLSIFYFSSIYSQGNYDSAYFGGTVVAAAFAHNAIIMGADSRTFVGGFNKALNKWDVAFYVDGNRKIFQCGKYLLGFVGHQGYKNFSMEKLADSFLTKKPTYTDPNNFLFQFISFLQKSFNACFRDIEENGDIICCGYYYKKPQIAHFTGKNLFVCNGGSYSSLGGSTTIPKFRIDTSLSSYKQLKFIRFVIDSFPYGIEKIIIGGPTLVVKIDPNNCVAWPADIKKFHRWYYTMDYLKALFTNKLKITPVDYEGTTEMLARLRKQYDTKTPE
jgi:hypothetical protein